MANEIKIDIQEIHAASGAKITAVGVGGGGSNMIAHLIATGTHKDIKLIATNTDVQHLENSPAPIKIKLGEKLTKGLGAGMRPEVGQQAAQESFESIKEVLAGSDIIFISTGLGGGTGTGAAPVIAQAAKEVGALTIAVVTKPFKMEGNKRAKLAEDGLKELKKASDGIVVIPNEKLLSIVSRNAGIKECFKEVDNVLARAVNGISSIILNQGDINTDFADLKTVMTYRGLSLMGTGEASGESAALEAVKSAIESPLFDNLSINGAKGLLVNFEMNPDYSLLEISSSVQLIQEVAHEDADVIWGMRTVPDMPIDQVRATIIATGFEQEIIDNTPSVTSSQIDSESLMARSTMVSINTLKLVSGGDDIRQNLDIPTIMRNQRD